jgi:hypothetical protein
MSTVNQAATDAAAEVTAARAKLDELLEIEKLLETQLPAARAVLQAAEKRLRALTKPDCSACRKHELDLLKKRLEEARNA